MAYRIYRNAEKGVIEVMEFDFYDARLPQSDFATDETFYKREDAEKRIAEFNEHLLWATFHLNTRANA